MLNYIWGGLIIASLVFALISDFTDVARDTYANGATISADLASVESLETLDRQTPVTVTIDSTTLLGVYGVNASTLTFEGELFHSQDGTELRFGRDASLPEPLATIREQTGKRENILLARIQSITPNASGGYAASFVFRPVRFVKMNAIAAAALSFAETAVSICLGLIGILALWLGLLRIGEKAGLIEHVVRFVQPVLRRLFPEIPRDHPAMGMIALNMTANMLGLGNAATPLGIKAMEELKTLTPDSDAANNSMVTLLALATGSVQLIPPTLLVALMGLQVNQLIFAIIIATAISTITGVVAARLLSKLPRYRRTDPMAAGQ